MSKRTIFTFHFSILNFQFILALVLSPARGAGLDIVQERWGFGGHAVPDHINLLSLEIANNGSEPFSGAIRLFRADLLGGARGAVLVQDCYITPGASRWVQFFPYVGTNEEPWNLECEGALVGLSDSLRSAAGPASRGPARQVELRLPGLGPPAWVMLFDESDPLTPRMSLPLFPDDLFPPTVAATDGCFGIVLDHAPRWEPVRQEAFLDWLRRGGQLRIVHGRTGRYPAFGGPLAALNNPAESFRIGAGLVVRHPIDPRQLTAEGLAGCGISLPTMEPSEHTRVYDIQEWIFERLAGMAQPKHEWVLIYLAILAYLGLVGPVQYVYARERRDYRHALAFFLLAVLGASLLLGFLGQRGQNEAAAVHAISYARQIDADHYDVAQWGSAFVVSGATYELTHDAPHRLYAAARAGVRDGEITSGKEGRFRVEIPLNSAQSYYFRGKLKGPPIRLRVVRWEEQNGWFDLALEPGPGFPTDCAGLWAVRQGNCYSLFLRDSRIECLRGNRTALDAFVGDAPMPRYYGRWNSEEDDSNTAPAKVMPPLARLLLCHSVGGTGTFAHVVTCPDPDSGRARIFILAPSPESFDVQGRRLGRRVGYVLYEVDVFRPE